MREKENKTTAKVLPTTNECLKACVCAIVGITEEEYNSNVYHTAYIYLEEYMPVVDDQSVETRNRWIESLVCTDTFWTWWGKRWLARDEQFIDNIAEAMELGSIDDWYFHTNNGRNIATTTKLPGVVMKQAFALMNKKGNK